MKQFLNNQISEDKWKVLTELKNVVFALLILIDFIFILIITFFNVSYDDLFFMAIFDLIICFLIFIQLCYEFKNYDNGLLSFVKENYVDMLAMIPFNFIFLRYLAAFRIVRLLQVLQIFKIFNLSNYTRGSLKYFIQNHLLKLMALIVFLYLMFSSLALKVIDPAFTSVFDAFWFNLVTLTSVGYGDFTPATNPGKVMTMFSIVIGIMFVSVFTAAMSALYMEKPEEVTRQYFKQEIGVHVDNLKMENQLLHDEIAILKDENKVLNDKLDKVLYLLDDGGDDDEA